MYRSLLHSFLFLLLACTWSTRCFAQNGTADTVSLDAVDVFGSRLELYGSSRQVTKADSATRYLDSHGNAADFATEQCALFIKSYGSGGSATITSRGTEARHTAVLWNGFTINSPSLGVSDLSLVPVAHFGNMTFVHGGSSQLNGNASVGGALLISSEPPSFSGVEKLTLQTEVGSFGLLNVQGGFHYGWKSFEGRTTIFRQASTNDFTYSNTAKNGKPEEKQQHASMLNSGFIQDFSFRLAPGQTLLFSIWCQVADREIPSLMTSSTASTSQTDTLIRGFASYNIVHRRTALELKAARLDDIQEYRDDRRMDPYSYRVTTWHAEVSGRYSVTDFLTLHAGITGSFAVADFREYTQQQERNTWAPYAGVRWQVHKDWQIDAHLRKEFTNAGNGPVSPVAGLSGTIFPGKLRFLINAGRHYALPTLNDLYWVPGGNDSLKAEDAWSGDAGFVLFNNSHNLPSITLTGFYCTIENWIRWQPGAGGVYSPNNNRELESYGFESAVKYVKSFGQFSCSLFARYVYCRSSLKQAESPSETALKGKQLTYTPEHMFSGQFILSWMHASVTYRHQVTGARYTTADNSASLDGYQVASLVLDYKFNIGISGWSVFTRINNLYNETYQVLAWYPTPGRWYSAGLNIDLNFKKQYKP